MPVTRRLVILVVAVLLPAMLAAIWGLSQAYQSRKASAEQSLRELTRALAAVVAQDFGRRAAVLQTLVRSPSLEREDLHQFYDYARAIVASPERTVVLAELDGRQILNTRLPLASERLPATSGLPDLRSELGLSPEAVLVSDVYFAQVAKRHSFAIQVPVMRDGKAVRYLAMGSYVETLQRLLDDQRLREGWNASILDRKGVLAARRIGPKRFVGKPATEDMIAHLKAAPEGLFDTVRLDGVSTLTAYAPIADTGWTFVVSMPKAELLAPLRQALVVALGAMALLFGLALAVALAAGRSITRQFQRASEQIRSANAELERRVESAVSESRRAQEALLQAQKLEALGRLTGGIAHDFNNLLQTISVSIEVVMRRSTDATLLAAADAGRRAVQNAVKITRQLVTFGRGQPAARETVDLRDQILKLQDLVTRALRSNIRLEVDFAGDLWPATLDTAQLEVAILNMALNARDAMPSGGTLRISAHNVRVAKSEEPGLSAGDYVRIDVADTGQGIPADVVPRVFEPFFTTKDVGKGAGLGLAQVYAFATGSGGSAKIESAPGKGTTLSLFLPRAAEAPRRSAEKRANPPELPGPRTVLFVEDDALVQKVVAPALENAGFRVIVAANVEEALSALAREGKRIDVVFSDVVMPGGRSGADLAAELRLTRPGLPMVLATGYTDVAPLPAGVRVLSKPYRMEELRATLIEALADYAHRT